MKKALLVASLLLWAGALLTPKALLTPGQELTTQDPNNFTSHVMKIEEVYELSNSYHIRILDLNNGTMQTLVIDKPELQEAPK